MSLGVLLWLSGIVTQAQVASHVQGIQEGTRSRPSTQPDTLKLDRYVRDACGTHPLIRIQAARRVVRAGERGFEACLRFIRANGRQALSADLVQALGNFSLGSSRKLLRELVADPEFIWRPQAMRGLAMHPTRDEEAILEAGLGNPSWLVRREAMTGWTRLKRDAARKALHQALADVDLRVRVHAAGLLLEQQDDSGLQVLVDALDAEEEFFGEDFGLRVRRRAFGLLRKRAGEDKGYDALAPREARRAAVSAFRSWASLSAEGPGDPGSVQPVQAHDWRMGYERRSCRLGDLYYRFDSEGRLFRGLFQPVEVELPVEKRKELLRAAASLTPPGRRVFGKIRCDFERFAGLGKAGKDSLRCSPGSVPKELAELYRLWLPLIRR